MEDIGGILFYIIAAVIGIVTTVANKKKKAAKPSVSSDTIEMEVFDESFEEVEDIVYQPIPEAKFSSEDPTAVSDPLEEDDLTEEKDLNTEDAGKGRILKDFDVKKAVIYSEILNRKYS